MLVMTHFAKAIWKKTQYDQYNHLPYTEHTLDNRLGFYIRTEYDFYFFSYTRYGDILY